MTALSDTSVSSLKGVGPRIQEHLQRLHIQTVQDLLFHLPLRYEDRTRVARIAELNPGDRVLIEGEVMSCAITGNRKANLSCRFDDGSGTITLRFFHFTAAQRRQLSVAGLRLRCFGEIRKGYRSGLEMIHPEYTVVQEGEDLQLSDRLTPIYPTTKGLHQITLRKLTDQALVMLQAQHSQIELLPDGLLSQLNYPDLISAIQLVHRPPVDVQQDLLLLGEHPAQKRLAFEELIAHQLSLQRSRYLIREHPAPQLNAPGKLQQQLLASLPFQLTNAQQRVLDEIQSDIQQAKPMLRLLQGDVGSGKTIVAAVTALAAVELGYQVAVMAPTELLAEQHLTSFKRWLEPLGIQVGWLSGSVTAKTRRDSLQKIHDGDVAVVIGTHALFQDDVHFKNLALLIVDEQHRFGVHQRLALKEKGIQQGMHPHQLIMTATPIPRTLAMSVYSDLDNSVIDELPPGRKPINTILVSNARRDEVVSRVQHHCDQQHQAYWVCTLIEESEVLQCQAAEATASELQQLLPNVRIGLVHGRMKADEKEKIMQSFKANELQLLVATTVIEVGVDVPNASLMIIENPERLGLAQLHQLRGRVGRGSLQSHCVLLYQSPLSNTAQDRLLTMRNTNDGFAIAHKDLEMRGPGEVLGTRQAGLVRMRIADLMRDKELLPEVQAAGKFIVANHSDIVLPLIQRWVKDAEQYVQV